MPPLQPLPLLVLGAGSQGGSGGRGGAGACGCSLLLLGKRRLPQSLGLQALAQSRHATLVTAPLPSASTGARAALQGAAEEHLGILAQQSGICR